MEPGSAAAKPGIRPADEIVEDVGQPLMASKGEEAAERLFGRTGDQFQPTVRQGQTDHPSGATFTIAASCTFSEFTLLPMLPTTIDSGGTSLISDFVDVAASAPSCPWTATSTVPWAVVVDNASATGTFDNGSNNHQNSLRISAGVVIHFGKR